MTQDAANNSLSAQIREKAGTGSARKARRENRVPAIIYGSGKEQVLVTLEERALVKQLGKGSFRSRLLELDLGKEKINAIPREVQYHPVSDRPTHVDFQRVLKGEKVHVMVKVVFENIEKSQGIKRGGVLNVVRHEVELICLPEAIPQQLTLNLADTKIGDSLHASAVKLPSGVAFAITDRDFTIATIAGRSEKEETVDESAPTASAADVVATKQKSAEEIAAADAAKKAADKKK